MLRNAIIVSLILALGACAPRSGDFAPAGSIVDDTVVSAIAPQVSAIAPQYVEPSDVSSTRILLPAGADSIGIELVDGAQTNQINFFPPAGVKRLSYDVNRIDFPPRVVIDIKGVQNSARGSREFDTSDAELVSKVRLGVHPDKSRVVLDLATDQKVDYSVADLTDSGGFSIALARTAGSAEQYQAPEVAMLQAPEAEPIGSKLIALKIEPISSNENLLVAQVSGQGHYNLARTAPSEYVLKFSDTGIESSQMMTLVAAPGSGAIRSVRPVSMGGDVVLRIFTQPHNTLAVRSSEGRIVVSAANPSDAKDEFRAQAKEGAAPPEDDKTQVAKAPAATNGSATNGTGDIDLGVSALLEEAPKYTGRLISLDLQDTDIDNALRIIAEVSNLNIIASQDVAGKVTLRLIDVPWDQALDVILKTNGLDKVQEGNVVRIAPVEKLRLERESLKQAEEAERELQPLDVRYVRISYAKASDLKPLVESVLSERGSVAYDERTNQLIVKDIKEGIKNVARLVEKLDLRTPQVLLETQIVEANRNLLRDLGSEFGFNFVQSPATGNATGANFPNAVNIGGSATANNAPPGTISSFPATGSSAISFLLESADATKSLGVRLSALETEGRARVISRPAVATTNNKQATIKSVEKIRIKTPSGGLSVATGSGASASGSSAVATESVEIGIILEVTPQASPDYFVLLDINAKSSALGNTFVDGIPSEIERSATSSVLVSSGQTFAMGGIYRIRDRDDMNGVPFLKDIPVFGTLFRQSKIDNADEELLFFLTPRIIEGSFDDAAMKAST